MMEPTASAAATTAERLLKLTGGKSCRFARAGSLRFVLLVLVCGGFLPVGHSFPSSSSHHRERSSPSSAAAASASRTTISLLGTLFENTASSKGGDSSPLSKKSVSPSGWMGSYSSPRRRMPSQMKMDYIKSLLNYRQLYCQTKFHLQIWSDGTVNGTEKNHQRHAILQIKSEGFGVVTFKGAATNLYLAMDKNGRLYGSKKKTEDVYFEEDQKTWWNTYYSENHRNGHKKMYISLNKHGIPREGGRQKGNHKTVQFLTVPVDPDKVDYDLYNWDFIFDVPV